MVGELLGQQVKGRLSSLTSIPIIEYCGILRTLSEQDLVDAPPAGLTMTPLFLAFIVEAEQTFVVAVSRPDLIYSEKLANKSRKGRDQCVKISLLSLC